jgi:hypothetical protein
LDQAILDLSVREDCSKDKIGFFKKSDRSFYSKSTFIKANIASWIDRQEEFEAVIWTDLSKNFKDKIDIDLTEENALKSLLTD